MSGLIFVGFLSCLVSIVVATDEYMRFDGYSVFRLIPKDDRQLKFLQQIASNESFKMQHGLDFWKYPSSQLSTPVDVMLSPEAKLNVLPLFYDLDIDSTLMIEDVQRRVNEENAIKGRQNFPGSKFTKRTFDQFFSTYQRHPQIIAALETLGKSYPNLTTIETIGKSFENRDLTVIKITRKDGKPKKKIWIDAGLHAREWIGPATAMFVAHKLVTDYGKDSRVTSILNNFEVYVLPLANPDGYEYTHTYNRMWRKTRSRSATRWGFLCRGTDPNRNWAYQWRTGGASNNPCSDIYAGETAFSEPETKAMSQYILKEFPFEAYLTLHSYSQLILSPWGWTDILPSDNLDHYRVAKAVSKSMSKLQGTLYNYGATTHVLYVASGGSDDWAYAQGIKYSYTFELRDTGYHGFLLPEDQILPQGQEFFEGFLTLVEEIDPKYLGY